jgi:broad specificity phosphatase PhoE
MTTIYLVRHGDKVIDKGDVSLTPLGITEAQETGKYFLDKNIDLILSSPQKRALQTAEIIQKILKTPPLKVNDILKERINFGDVSNQSYEEFIEMAEKSSLQRDWVLPNGETSLNCGRRMESVIPILALGAFRNIMLVTHGGIIADFLRNAFSKKELNEKFSQFDLKYESAIQTCSITQLEVDKSGVKLITIGDVSHLLNLRKV